MFRSQRLQQRALRALREYKIQASRKIERLEALKLAFKYRLAARNFSRWRSFVLGVISVQRFALSVSALSSGYEYHLLRSSLHQLSAGVKALINKKQK